MAKTVYFCRHAQAEHNVAEDYSSASPPPLPSHPSLTSLSLSTSPTVPDAPLTKLGRQQSADLRNETQDGFQKDAQLLVSSPLRRPMQTAIIGFAPLRERLDKAGKPMVLLPELQEVNDLPCDTGSDRTILESDPEFASLDFTSLTPSPAPPHWDSAPSWTSKQGIFNPERVTERARWVRRWVRERSESKIVVVAHGDILRVITDGRRSATPWANAEVRAYTFSDKPEDQDDAVVVPVREVAKEGEEEPTTTDMKEGRTY
ncbi:histidine phosphatase superfamily [Rhodotorula diobovata]|uniref:Histidine phosphatase superfamily n=1 Tax=Rhodotorula diobovata TaxID=5288 RepID=A0A5C5FS30_9BASI|nr:histidine phosphatase superfamily [Rhodotorula diobovata]